MQRPLQIVFKGMQSSPALESLIRERVAHLERLYPRITGCRVVVEVPHRSPETAKVPIAVSVEADIPGRKPIVGRAKEDRREVKNDHTAALNNAFEAVERQLEKIADIRSDESRMHEDAGQSGMVVRLFPEQGYGFIELDGSPELYFTRNAVVGDRFDELEVGMMVYVTRATLEGPMGPQASSVRLLDRSKVPPRPAKTD
ncbi:MAG TPA: HPF/RaiA family ribosome-associated protein [Hyphomicrobiaceae bacterium]|nr:HPF/RaiA family ribosome-associated protein [Hyphomicrobiaceae bacterium]